MAKAPCSAANIEVGRVLSRVSADMLSVTVWILQICHYVSDSDFARDEVVPDQTPILVK